MVVPTVPLWVGYSDVPKALLMAEMRGNAWVEEKDRRMEFLSVVEKVAPMEI